ncbi:protein yippee-like At5g53940 [Nymphaea colorata]|nr:protein yippee-like At5g53940 [Nymphaea colorata]
MGRVYVVELEGKIYRCKFCLTHLALLDDLVSKAFHCRRGKAYLFNNAVNIIVGDQEERLMISGMHTVADIFCCCCGQIVGWKYEAAHEQTQKYKEGKYILERGRIIDGIDPELYLDTQMGGSDAEDA